MNYAKILWVALTTLFMAVLTACSSGKVYIQDYEDLQKASSHVRLRRQTHPAATIAKLPTQDSGAFVPIVGPTQSLAPQFPSFQNDFFSNTIEFPSLQSVPNTLVDYLVPPSPDSLVTSLNFQDPAANLQNIENAFDVTSPTSSSSNNLNTFQPFHNLFPPSASFQNPNQQPLPSSTTQSTFTNDQVQSISFQNPPLAPSSAPSVAPTPLPPSNANNFFSNKISNPLNRDAPSQLNAVSQLPPNQFNIQTPPPANFPKNEALQDKPAQQPNQGKWELGFDANEILAPPREESFGRAADYDTINVARFRRPSTNLSPPPGNAEPPINQIQPPANQFFNQFAPPNFQFTPFNQFPSGPNAPTNDPFIPVTNQFPLPNNQVTTNQFAAPNKESNDPNVIWGTQKQANISPTTAAPFLPTIPPNTNSNVQQPFQQNNPQQTFQNGPQPPFQSVQPPFQHAQQPPNFQNNGFNPVPPPQQLQFQQPPAPTNQQLFDLQNLNQNFPLDTPLTSQFDSFLPQGTVSDHSFQPFGENGRHFQKKRQVNEEEVDEQHPQYDDEPESKFRLKHAGPVYSFVKTDRDGHFKWSIADVKRRRNGFRETFQHWVKTPEDCVANFLDSVRFSHDCVETACEDVRTASDYFRTIYDYIKLHSKALSSDTSNYSKFTYVPGFNRRQQYHEGVAGPIKTFAKTNHHAHFSWGVKHNVGHGYAK